MQFKTYVRKPFTVEAVEVTEDNIDEIAKMCGTIETTDRGDKFIKVDQEVVKNVTRVYVGFWMTKNGGSIRFYSKRIFTQQFIPNSPNINESVKFINASHRKAAAASG